MPNEIKSLPHVFLDLRILQSKETKAHRDDCALHSPEFTCLKRSNRRTESIKTCAPFAQSLGAQYSAGLWESPSRQGTKIIEVGHRRLVNTLSWPITGSTSPQASRIKVQPYLPQKSSPGCNLYILFPADVLRSV